MQLGQHLLKVHGNAALLGMSMPPESPEGMEEEMEVEESWKGYDGTWLGVSQG